MIESSPDIYNLYSKITPGGNNSNIRYDKNFVKYYKNAKGSYIWSVENEKFLDCISGYGSIILGHSPDYVNNAVCNAIQNGITNGYETENSYVLADKLSNIIPSAEMVRLSNTGTEAVMHAIMIARAYTKRNKILKFDGAYHGWYDFTAFNYRPNYLSKGDNIFLDSTGIDDTVLSRALNAPYNDFDATENIIKEYKSDISCVIIEPIMFNSGAVLPDLEFLKGLREITELYDIPLIFDEVITGFRVSPGGAQEKFNIIPDISVFGKALGNGYPISAVVGKSEYITLTSPTEHLGYAGTFNGNQISVAAAIEVLKKLETGDVQNKLNKYTNELASFVNTISNEYSIPVKLYGMGGQFQVYFSMKEVTNYKSASESDESLYGKFMEYLIRNGILFHNSKLFHHGITNSFDTFEINHLKKMIEKAILYVKFGRDI